MEAQLSEDLDTSKADMVLYPTPEQQRNAIKKIENDRTTYSYFVCKSWYHQWKAHVNYHDLGTNNLDNIITQQPMVTEKEILSRRATCRGPGLAVAATQNETVNGVTDDEVTNTATANHKTDGTQTINQISNEQSNWENSDDHSPILASSTPIKSDPVPKASSSLLRRKPKLTRVCRNSSKTEIDSSFETSDNVEMSTERVKPINPILAGLKGEGRKGEKPDANASITEIFEQAKDRQVKLNNDRSNRSGGSESGIDMKEEGRRDLVDKHVTFSMKPGPLERDTDNDQNNILVNENVWQKLVQWYGLSETHDLGRAFTNADKNCFEDFGISLLSPVMTFTERPIRSLNIRDEVGYIELQIRKLLQVPAHKSTRLWIREKDQKSKLKLMLDRCKSLGVYQEELKCDLSCILALEIMDLEGMWPSGYPGAPVGRLDKYLCLVGHQTAMLSWEQQLQGAIDDIMSKLPADKTTLQSAIIMTTKHILETTKADMDKSKEQMDTQTTEFHMMAESLKFKIVTVQEKDKRLTSDLEALKVKENEFKAMQEKFETDIAKLKEINKIAETQVKLDIGGHHFITSAATLTSDPNSLLGTMFSGVHPIKPEQDGSYFIDRDGTHFRYVLNFLRDGSLGPIDPTNHNTLLELLAEAEYYKISGLISAVKDIMIKEGMAVNETNVPERTPSKIPLRRLYEKGQSVSSDPVM